MSNLEAEGRTVLLVGAGFLGKFFATDWLSKNPYNKLIILDKIESSAFFSHPLMRPFEQEDRLVYVWGNANDPQQLINYFSSDKSGPTGFGVVDDIVYTAAIADVPYAEANPNDTFYVNVTSTKSFMHYFGEMDFRGKIVLMSSESVYAKKPADTPEDDIAFKETDPVGGHSVYGNSKLAQENAAWGIAKSSGLNLTVIRSATMYGMYARPKQVIPTFIRQVLTLKPITLMGDGLQTSRDFVNVLDTVHAIETILATDSSITKGETFNIGSGRETFLLNLANAIKELCGQPSEPIDGKSGLPRVGFVPFKKLPFREGEKGARVVLNIKKAKDKLKMRDRSGKLVPWEPEIDLIHGLRATIYQMGQEVGYDEKGMEELHYHLFPEKYKGRTETNPHGFRAN
jgi:nucleoside-diphosphate-sugar epimerase